MGGKLKIATHGPQGATPHGGRETVDLPVGRRTHQHTKTREPAYCLACFCVCVCFFQVVILSILEAHLRRDLRSWSTLFFEKGSPQRAALGTRSSCGPWVAS